MPHRIAGSATVRFRAMSAVSPSNTSANRPRESAAPGPLTRLEHTAIVRVTEHEPQIAGAPVAGDVGGGAHGMYMPPLTCTMFPVM